MFLLILRQEATEYGQEEHQGFPDIETPASLSFMMGMMMYFHIVGWVDGGDGVRMGDTTYSTLSLSGFLSFFSSGVSLAVGTGGLSSGAIGAKIPSLLPINGNKILGAQTDYLRPAFQSLLTINQCIKKNCIHCINHYK